MINVIIGHHTIAGAVMFYGISLKETVALDALKVNSAERLIRIVAAGFSGMFKCPDKHHRTPLQHSHGENLPHLSGLPEVPHLSCETNQEKKRLYGEVGNPT